MGTNLLTDTTYEIWNVIPHTLIKHILLNILRVPKWGNILIKIGKIKLKQMKLK